PLAAALAVTVNGEALLPVPLELPPGVSAVRLPYRFANAGAYLLEAKLLLAPGAPPAPGAVAAAITVTGPLRVLVVGERARPVELQSQRPEPKEREPIALYVVLDRSDSMGFASGPNLPYGAKMEYAKRAALAVVDQLGPHDLVGAIAFDSEPYELSPLLPLAEGRAALTAKIRQLQYGGGTRSEEHTSELQSL